MNDSRFEVYPQKRAVDDGASAQVGPTREFGWRFRDANGQISAIGGEGFTRRADAHRAIEDFREAVLAGGKRIAWRPIVDVNAAGDVIDPATGAPIVP